MPDEIKNNEQVPRPPAAQNIIITHHVPKSVGVAVLLSIFFGPLGMFYSTVLGGSIMLIVSIIIGLLTLGLGLIVTWPICVIWAAVAANKANAKAEGRVI